jgi:purine-binding chemotaxis protein CheW
MAEPAAAPSHRYLTFRVNEGRYALPAEVVSEIINSPAVAKLPHSPKALLGMANLRGTAVAVASIAALLGQEAKRSASAPRAIVLSGAAPVVLEIDSVDSLVALAPEQIESDIEGASGAFQRPGEAATKILDIHRLLAGAFHVKPLVRHLPAERAPAPEAFQNARQVLLLRFEAGQNYALPLDEVSEIAAVPPEIAGVARDDAVILGIAALRERLLTVLSLRGLLGWPRAAGGDQEKMIVTRVAGRLVGLVVDRVQDILAVPAERLEPVPGVLAARLRGETRLKAIFRGEGGRLVPVLGAETLLGDEVMNRLGKATERTEEVAVSPGAASQYLVFRLGEEEFGLAIDAVDEVAASPEALTRLPRMPKFLRGVVNLRGEVLPVIDQRARFDLPAFTGEARRQRLIVVRGARHRAGLIVDAVSEVLTVADAAIEGAPELHGETTKLVSGVVNLDATQRMILLLNADELLSRSEAGLLAAFTAKAGVGAT